MAEYTQKDDSPSMGSARNEEGMEPDHSTPKKVLAYAPDDLVVVGVEGNVSRLSKLEESSGNRSPRNQFGKVSLDDSGVNHSQKQKVSSSKMVATVGNNVHIERSIAVPYPEDETGRTAAMGSVNVKQRLGATLIWKSRWSPELSDGKKRPAIMCSYFAKGWCIKGNSCRFLHIRDGVGSQLEEGVEDAAKQKRENPLGEDSSVVEDSAVDGGKIPNWKNGLGGSQKGDLGSSSSSKYGHYASPSVKCTSPSYSNASLCGVFSGSPIKSSGSNRQSVIPHTVTRVVESTSNKTQVPGRDEIFPSSSLGQERSSFPFGSSCWNADNIRSRKFPDPGQEYQATVSSYFKRNYLPFLGSTSGSQIQTKQPAEYKTISCDDWEPSVPFRPSYLITQQMLSIGKPYDPIFDSIEQTHTGDELFQQTAAGKGASKDNEQLQVKAYTKAAGSLCPEYNSACNFSTDEVQKRPSIIESSVPDTSSAIKQESGLLNAEESSLNSIQSRGISGASEGNADNESQLHTDIKKYTSEAEVVRDTRGNEADVDLKSDLYVQKELKELKNFHTVLVEHVKELIRQPWHEGRLTKDAYKLIVKKAVEKVRSSFEPHQIPKTSEDIDQYIILSQTKLVKLVEGYVLKYGKSLPG